MATYRLLHVSDLHYSAEAEASGAPVIRNPAPEAGLTPTPNLEGLFESHKPEVLEALTRLVDNLFHPADDGPALCDALLMTGDLATTGNDDDLAGIRNRIEPLPPAAPADPNASTISTGTKPLLILPGNHDRYTPRTAQPGHRRFDSIFRDFWNPANRIAGKTLYGDDGTALILMLADFTLAAGDNGSRFPFAYLGQGRSEREAIETLKRANETMLNASDVKNRRSVSLWCIHFDPLTSNPLLRLLDRQHLNKALRPKTNDHLRIVAMLGGHTHKHVEDKIGQCPVIVSAATTAAKSELHGCSLLEFNVSPDPRVPVETAIVRMTYQKSGQVGEFTPHDPQAPRRVLTPEERERAGRSEA